MNDDQKKAIKKLAEAMRNCKKAGLDIAAIGYESEFAHPVEDIHYDESGGRPTVVVSINSDRYYDLDYVDEVYNESI